MFRFFENRKSKRTRINRRGARRGRRLRAVEALEDRRMLAVFVVDNLVDEIDVDHTAGDFSLREALAEANANVEADTIHLGPGVHVLSLTGAGEDSGGTGDLDILNDTSGFDLTIVGAGAGVSIIDASGLGDRVFHIQDDALVSIEGLTITGGTALGTSGFAGVGGGIAIIGSGSSLSLLASEVTENSSVNGGGGIYNREAALTVRDSLITLNTTNGSGGGIGNDRGFTIVERSTISENLAANHGGGINSQVPGAGALGVSQSTFVFNEAQGFGGGINVDSGPADVSLSTFSANTANFGGGIRTTGILTVTSSTLFDNSATMEGGGIYKFSGLATVGNTIVAGNLAPTNPDVRGVFVSADFNLIGDVGSSGTYFAGAADQVGTAAIPIDPLLGPLQDNGGPTATHAVLPGSPALDAGSDFFAAAVDQRGFLRPIVNGPITAPGGDGSDIGAFEFVPEVVGPTEGAIDVQPHRDHNFINLRGRGALNIAILSDETLDATTVDVDSVLFGGATAARHRLVDVDRDGDLDLVLRFSMRDVRGYLADLYFAALADDPGASWVQQVEVTMTWQTTTGDEYFGTDSVNLFFFGGRRHDRDRHDRHDRDRHDHDDRDWDGHDDRDRDHDDEDHDRRDCDD